ncbi:MAG: ABC transporter substrate-binding protein [Deltaproteobacteria bacterium]|uniref:ABC transporter substrate-binding protein n=1 Tax=Desulfobacula sp. TaxID=2593537 RepID=UPI0019BB860F|nr:ABC transporter substrate-binding protein [Candidatus Desulfobacula maris]MBL6993095.1 ABC transporter substrate-binding protein [Desulfobacula sp.]
MKPTGKIILAAGLTLILLIATPLWAQPGTLKIGLLAPMTGSPNPDWGKKQVVGLEMALARVNQRGGIGGNPLEAVIMGTSSDPQQGVAAYRKMADEDKVLVIIGPLFTNIFIDLIPVTNEKKVAIIATASATPGLSDLGKWPYAFRMTVTSDKKEGPLIKSWVEANTIKDVVILYDRESVVTATIAEKIWPKIMQDLNVRILYENDPISFPEGQTDFAALVQKALTYSPSGIGISAMSREAGRLIKELRGQGYGKSILGASTTANPKVIEIAGAAAEDLWSMSLFYPEDPNPKVKQYVEDFKRKCTDRYPDMNCDSEQYDVVVHDILLFVADIMKKKGITGDSEKLQQERDKIREGLADMGVWRGTAGMMAFDRMGDGIRTVHILKVKDGRWQPVR